jgi:hypothetical protein
MLEKLIKYVLAIALYICIVNNCVQGTFFFFLGFNILAYTDYSEMLFSSLFLISGRNFLFFTVAILMLFLLALTQNLRIEKMIANLLQSRNRIIPILLASCLGMLIITGVIMFKYKNIINASLLIILSIILLLLTIFFLFNSIRFSVDKRIIYLIILFIGILLSSLYGGNQARIIISGGLKARNVKIYKNSSTFQSNDTLQFVAENRNFIFLYDRFSKRASVIKKDGLDSIVYTMP